MFLNKVTSIMNWKNIALVLGIVGQPAGSEVVYYLFFIILPIGQYALIYQALRAV